MKIHNLAIAREVFKTVSRRRILLTAFGKPSAYYLADLYLLSAFVLMFGGVAIYANVKIAFIPSVGSCVLLMVRINAALRSIYPDFYEKHSLAIKQYRADFKLLRFLIFRDALQARCVSPIQASACLNLTQKEHELTEFQSATSHPHIAWLAALIGGVIAGTGGIDKAWLNGVVPVLLYSALVLFGYALIFADLFRPKRFTEKEFELFLHWYANEVTTTNPGPAVA